MSYTGEDHTWLICAYRESAYLEECIQSLRQQTVPSRMIITTSTPNTHISCLGEKYNIPVHVNPVHSGIGEDWNFALETGNTELLTIAHQDDIYEPFYTEELLKAANRKKNIIIYFTNYGELRNGRKVNSNRLLRVKRLVLFPVMLFPASVRARRLSLSFGNPICCPSATYRKSVIRDYPFSTNYKSNMDWDMHERLSRLKGLFFYNTKICMYHRIHRESTTSETIVDHLRTEEDYEILKKFWPEKMARKWSRYYAISEKSNEV